MKESGSRNGVVSSSVFGQNLHRRRLSPALMSVKIYPCVKNGLMATELPIAGASNPSTVELPGDTMRLLRTATNYGYIC
ncbi:hypothetical protein H9L39_10137 [Fusarium oxysporum f. sp. albedinis]|nr:hypothetical protein H9L39_10137 [Fusarium oxysporum f. sp. albedinis]